MQSLKIIETKLDRWKVIPTYWTLKSIQMYFHKTTILDIYIILHTIKSCVWNKSIVLFSYPEKKKLSTNDAFSLDDKILCDFVVNFRNVSLSSKFSILRALKV